MSSSTINPVTNFIARWRHADGSELANAQIFVRELCELLKGKGPWKKRLPQLLDTLVVLGKARVLEDGRWMG